MRNLNDSVCNKSIFIDLLQVIGNNDLSWTLIYFEGVGDLTELSMSDFENIVKNKGYEFTWGKLKNFASKIDDFTWISLIAHKSKDIRFQKDKTSEDYSDISEISVDCIDGSLWEFTAKDPSLFEKLSKYFATIRS
jgi:hypothetical protein